MVVRNILAQHAEDAAFLWLQRDTVVRAPHYDLNDLAGHDSRLEAHIDGLRVASEFGWTLALEQAQGYQGSGELFAAAVLALEQRDEVKVDAVLAVAEANPEAERGFISALGWVGRSALKGTGLTLLNGGSPFLRRLGIAACAVQRVDPGEALDRAVDDEDPALRARALRAAGQLGRSDLLPALLQHLDDPDGLCACRAAWSAVRLGDRESALERLTLLAITDQPLQAEAADLVLRVTAPEEARKLIATQEGNPARRRTLIQAVGAGGDPHFVPWLIEQMAAPELARPAGEAFSMISGLDLADEDLEGEWPESFEAGPTENPEDEAVALDPDEDLPWPAPDLIETWWGENRGSFESGNRHLVGAPIVPEHCAEVLRTGYQRQRQAAALELALMDPDTLLFETRAPGFRQKKWLGLKG